MLGTGHPAADPEAPIAEDLPAVPKPLTHEEPIAAEGEHAAFLL